MLNIQTEGNRTIIDVREAVQKGLHPRNEIFSVIQQAPKGTIIELHLPHNGAPLVAGLESMGLQCVVNELEPHHFRILTVKTQD